MVRSRRAVRALGAVSSTDVPPLCESDAESKRKKSSSKSSLKPSITSADPLDLPPLINLKDKNAVLDAIVDVKLAKGILSPCKDETAREAECVICMENKLDSNFVGILNCKHEFCFSCIENWAKHENTCPLCKEAFTTISKEVGVNKAKADQERALAEESAMTKADAETGGGRRTRSKKRKRKEYAPPKPVSVKVQKKTQAETYQRAQHDARDEMMRMVMHSMASAGPLGSMGIFGRAENGQIQIMPGMGPDMMMQMMFSSMPVLPPTNRVDSASASPPRGSGRGGSSSARGSSGSSSSNARGTSANDPIVLDEDSDDNRNGSSSNRNGSSSSSSSNANSSSSSNRNIGSSRSYSTRNPGRNGSSSSGTGSSSSSSSPPGGGPIVDLTTTNPLIDSGRMPFFPHCMIGGHVDRERLLERAHFMEGFMDAYHDDMYAGDDDFGDY